MGLLEKVFGSGKLQSAQDQSSDEIALVTHVKDKVQDCRSSGSRVTHEGIWLTNIAYILGFDSVYYDTSSRMFRPVSNAGTYAGNLRRNRIHVNKILPTVQNRLARLCKNTPKYDVRPKSPDVEDKDAASLAKQIIELVWDKQKVSRKRIDLIMWAQQCGHSYLKVSYDDQLGNEILSPTGDIEYEGDIRVDVVSPFEIFPDPLAKTLDEAAWVVQAKVRKLDYFKAHYPERGHLVKEENAWLLSAQYEARINSLNSSGPTTSGTQNALKNAAIELSYYERRSKKYPQGRLIICANGILLEEKELPVGEIPFAKFDDCIVAGKYYSESIITHLRPIQDQYNRTISRRADWTNKMLAGKFISPRGSALMQESLNDQNGEVLEYTPVPNAPAPMAMSIPNIPSYAYTEEDRLQSMIYDISGINEVSRGQMPSAGIPAIGMQLLVEQDDTRIGITTEQHEESYAHIGKLIVRYAERFYQTERLLKLSGRSGEYKIKYFKGQDIRGNDDVIVVRGSTLPGNKALKRQEIINLYQQGMYGQPGDPKVVSTVLEMLEYGDVQQSWDKLHLVENQINKYLEMIQHGEMPPIHELDNHNMFIDKLNDFRMTDKYETLSPEIKQIFEMFLEGHIQAQMKLLNPGIDMPQPHEIVGPPPAQANPLAGAESMGQNLENQGGL